MTVIDRRGLLAVGATGALGATVATTSRAAQAARSPFLHGVASGDPLPHAVVIWTRVTPSRDARPGSGRGTDVTVGWEVALDRRFRRIVRRGRSRTSARRDHTVNVDVGGLEPHTTYWYRFTLGDARSSVGRTRTAPPRGSRRPVRLAVATCANFDWGWFESYRHLADQPDLDAVLHLGDYLYEYGPDGPLGEGLPAPVAPRHAEPPRECTTLQDYRIRHGHYRLDPDLQRLHARHPVIAVWDDHEIANDTWRDGAENHDEGEGAWARRARGARQAYLEWLPVRRDARSPMRVHRHFSFGRHVDLWMLDERTFRDEQPSSLAFSAGSVDPGTRADPDRTMLGEEQREWLVDGLRRSRASWKVLGNQVPFFPVVLGPGFPEQLTSLLAPVSPALAAEPLAYYVDDWNGYLAERRALVEQMAQVEDVLVLTGDVHQSYACEIPADPGTYAVDPVSVAVELTAPGISSPSLSTIIGQYNQPFGEAVEAAFVANETAFNPWIRYSDSDHCGYLLVEIDGEAVRAEWWHAADAQRRRGGLALGHTAEVQRGRSRLRQPSARGR